jgi:hypothetical protein
MLLAYSTIDFKNIFGIIHPQTITHDDKAKTGLNIFANKKNGNNRQ